MEVSEGNQSSINCFNKNDSGFVTVVSVGSERQEPPNNKKEEDASQQSGYVTVLKIGDEDVTCDGNVQTEEVLVYRLPGERLGFGLKFEGGTKASEFVKRLFIQSCARDSPASRVRGSWGCLTEGDEVLEIDAVSVKSMTRIDCVRCLKDSNVVIKLLVTHTINGLNEDDIVCITRSTEDLPLVISAEKKRTPPPPPPVPPRKIPRKLYKVESGVNIVIPPKAFVDGTNNQEQNITKINGHQPKNHYPSPRNSLRLQPRQSPEVVKRVRKVSEGSIGPPDAEVYLDLFSQESNYCQSESDDTGSSISTVVDRFSLPSTPIAIQKQRDLSNILNPFHYDCDDVDFVTHETYIFNQLERQVNSELDSAESLQEKLIDKKTKANVTLQPPANFQDAPLSYGNEDVRVVEALIETAHEEDIIKINGDVDMKIIKTEKRRPPPPPPRSKHHIIIKEKNNNNYETANEEMLSNLPRLVDFVPKPSKSELEQFESVKKFLQNERVACDLIAPFYNENHASATTDSQAELNENEFNNLLTCNGNNYSNDLIEDDNPTDFYTFNWNPSSQLATIGEDEEQEEYINYQRSPILIVENAEEDRDEMEEYTDQPDGILDQFESVMDGPALNSRQPPDGHEFPDYQESSAPPVQVVHEQKSPAVVAELPILEVRKPIITHSMYGLHKEVQSVRDIITIFSNPSKASEATKPNGNNSASSEYTNKGLTHKTVMNINTSSLYSAQQTHQSSFYKTTETKNMVDVPEPKLPEARPRELVEVRARNLPPPPPPPEPKIRESKLMKDPEETIKLRRDSLDIPVPVEPITNLHKRSQSLIDLSTEQRNKHWNQLAEQRSKGLSKLKGLVISEDISETSNHPIIDLPEIKSTIPNIPITENKYATFQTTNHSRHSTTPYLTTPIWNKESSDTLPKYSPAFKRKSLQVYRGLKSESNVKPYINSYEKIKQSLTSQTEKESRLPITLSLSDAPKSLESITSPTRSDCSFEYISSSPELKMNLSKVETRIQSYRINQKIDEGNCHAHDEESDNDSAVSSSQSSYISRNSPPASPSMMQTNHSNSSYNMLEHERAMASYDYNSDSLNRRLLKPQSVEAINRKNILASAKCSSGRDLKVGSPLIQRKFDEENNDATKTIETLVTEDVIDAGTNEMASYDSALDDQVISDEVFAQEEEAIKCDAAPIDLVVNEPKLNDFIEIKNEMSVEIIRDVAVAKDNANQIKLELKNDSIASEIKRPTTERVFASKINSTVTIENTKIKLNNVLKTETKKQSQIRNIIPRSISKNTKVASVTDLRKNYEKFTPVPIPAARCAATTTANTSPQTRVFLAKNQASPPKSNTIAKPMRTELDTADSQKIINETIKESTIDKKDVKIIVITPEFLGGSIGITLAGGMDYETKEITVHKVRNASPAFIDGRLKKGDRILSINGKTMTGLTHADSVAILKEPVPKVIIAVYCGKTAAITTPVKNISTLDKPNSSVPKDKSASIVSNIVPKKQESVVNLLKDSSGLGFSMDGGKDSPQGDCPLTIKKLFAGGIAEKCGKLLVGDELLEINGADVRTMPRIDAWSIMKKLPAGEVILRIRR